MKIDTNNYYYLLFTGADDANETVSDLFETLIGHKAPKDTLCFELTRFDDTYVVAYPRGLLIPGLEAILDDEANQEHIMECN